MNAQKRRGESKGSGFVIGLVILVAVFCYYKWKKDQGNSDKPATSTPRVVSSSTSAPLFSLGGTIDGFHFGVGVDTELTLTLEAGAAFGKAGATVPVARIKVANGLSWVFLPDEQYNPTLSLALTKHKQLTWSPEKGFGKDYGVEFSTLNGKMIFGTSTDSSNLSKLPVALGQLTFGKDSLTFLPGSTLPSSGGLSPSATKFLTLDKGEWTVKSLSPSGKLLPNEELSRLLGTASKPLPSEPPPHVIRSCFLHGWYPEMGYTWLDGTTGIRFATSLDLKVQWKPDLTSPWSAHIHTSTTEGVWEPDPGYNWDTPVTGWLGTVKWTPGLRHPYHPNVIASPGEGQWRPAAGFRWATDDTTDLNVAPLDGG
jgi:hypothetical protein